MDEIKKHLGEVYCCTTPFVIQAGLKFLSQVMDLATCPVDGLQNGVQAAMEEVEKEMNNMLNSVIKKVLAPVPNVAVRQPEIRPGKVEAENCTFELPDASTRTVYPFKPWLDALSSDKPSTAMFAHSAAALETRSATPAGKQLTRLAKVWQRTVVLTIGPCAMDSSAIQQAAFRTKNVRNVRAANTRFG